MRGFILAAGFGTRLRPITEYLPKALIPVGGKPLIERSLGFLASQGISRIGVNAHYQAEELAALRDQSPFPFELFHEKDSIRGTGGGLYFAQEFLNGDETFFVCNVDIVYELDLAPLIRRFLATDWIAGLLVVPTRKEGTVLYDADTLLYSGVPADTDRRGDLITGEFIGAAVYRREFLEELGPEDFSIVPVWKRCREQERGIGIIEAPGCFWRDIGTPDALADVHYAIIDGKANIDVAPHLRLDRAQKRCYAERLPESLQQGVGEYGWVETEAIGPDARIARSMVFPGARIAAGRSIENMIITPWCEVPLGK